MNEPGCQVEACSSWSADHTALPETAHRRMISAEMNTRNSSGDMGAGSAPISERRWRKTVSFNALTAIMLSFSTIGFGVPRGASRANHAKLSYPDNPASADVGTSGRVADLPLDAMASGLKSPDCT